MGVLDDCESSNTKLGSGLHSVVCYAHVISSTESAMSIQRRPHLTPEEYLALERTAEYKSEYCAGEIFAMAGASERHVSLVANLMYLLVGQLKGRPCKAYANDLRLHISPTGLYTYPDLLVVCGTPLFADEQKDTLLNPTVLMEVLSESTEAYDRGKKFDHYRTLTSVSDYLLVSQDQHKIEHFVRQAENRWLFSAHATLDDVVEIASIACVLPLQDVYDKIELWGGEPEEEANRRDLGSRVQDYPAPQLGGPSPASQGTPPRGEAFLEEGEERLGKGEERFGRGCCRWRTTVDGWGWLSWGAGHRPAPAPLRHVASRGMGGAMGGQARPDRP